MIKIYGKNCINEALRANTPLEIFIDEKKCFSEQKFLKMLQDKNIDYKVKSSKEMNALFGDNQGLTAFRPEYKYQELDFLASLAKPNQVLILDGINDPHNFGAIIRSAEAFGIKAVIIPKNRSVQVNETVFKVSTGAIEHINIIQVNNLTTTIKLLKEKGYWIVGTDALADKEASAIDKDLPLAIIIGSEGFGLSRLVKEQCDFMLKIPMKGHVNSLNASVSAGIVLALLNQ